MTTIFHPSMAERAIGRELRRWRNDAGLSLSVACKRAGFSAATLSLTENALKPFDPLDIMLLGRIYELPNHVWKQTVKRAEIAASERTQNANVPHSSVALDAARDVDDAYLEAVTICAFGVDVIPRFLQTPEYRISAAALGCPTYPADCPERTAAQQARWTDSLTARAGRGPTVKALISRDAIRRVVGNPTITNAALLQLIRLSEIETFTVQVTEGEPLPENSYFHLSFPHRQHGDAVYVEGNGDARYIEDSAVCELVSQSFRALQQVALSPIQSIEVIAETASTMTDGGN
ncbi:Scr1 family TA system antitoxin-like transcriptional regulator [Lentzea sp. BCCO 10_0856]|uniref:Scr1 family TA system antitoxin-like transcriptional regulator n=1 Tax=Lentzea miocenica TaxID=3095431 RepID=A0ABU4T5T8_9PSEU|nr:Scr1 family TA system antitoxin-like transcriptional regulator [Lentzea sp. BCCO 10_0856]MDX8033490.1 Scr1 family TA system antitoxin-like transcriptional regulator [Lentzea sp. BCCO 10_0856]